MFMSKQEPTPNAISNNVIEDNDEYLNIKETTAQVKINKRDNCKDKANKIPK